MSEEKVKPKTFKELQDEWLPNGKSGDIDYCIPICVGVVAQDKKSDKSDGEDKEEKLEQSEINKLNDTLRVIMSELNNDFGSFEWCKTKNRKRVQYNKLIVVSPYKNAYERHIVNVLENDYKAYCIKSDVDKKVQEEDTEENNASNKKFEVTYDNVAELCWATIAVWDGVTASGNAYNTVNKILNTEYQPDTETTEADNESPINYKQINYQLKFSETRPVYELFLPVEGNSDSKSLDYTYRKVFPHHASTESNWIFRDNKPDDNNEFIKAQNKTLAKNAEKTREANKRIAKLRKKIEKENKGLYDPLSEHHDKDKSGNSKPVPEYANITDLRHLYYDKISMYAQGRQKRLTIALIIISGIALTLFSLYSDLISCALLLMMYIIGMFFAYVFLWKTNAHGVHSDYLEFRTLAEGLRVQCYWYMSNINESVGSHYTVKFQKDILWAKQALNAWYVMDYFGKEDKDYVPDLDCIRMEWLGVLNESELETTPKVCKECGNGQFGFYKKRVKQSITAANKWKKLNLFFIITSLLISVILLVLIILNVISDFERDIGMFIMSVLNIITIAIACYTKTEAYPELAAKYSYCAEFSKRALQDYDYCFRKDSGEMSEKNKATIQAIFKQFGVEALEENSEWLMIKNDREPEVMN